MKRLALAIIEEVVARLEVRARGERAWLAQVASLNSPAWFKPCATSPEALDRARESSKAADAMLAEARAVLAALCAEPMRRAA